MGWGAEAWERLRGLPLTVESVELSFPRLPLAAWERVTTVIALEGLGETGLGEDVNYEAAEHDVVRQHGPPIEAVGTWTLGSFCELVGAANLFPAGPPAHEASLDYRRWAWESAALDLALRQADTDLATALDRTPRPVTFVSSARVGSPPTVAALQPLIDAVPGLRFKLDADADWDAAFLKELGALDRVDCIDFKAFYTGTIVDTDIPPAQVVEIARAVPEATLEDAAPGETTDLLAEHDAHRLSWDAPIHSVADIDALPIEPKRMNVKPSRIGSIQELLAVYDRLEELGAEMYGGGQFELSVGRGQIILLASLVHPHGANDTAPVVFHSFTPGGELPSSPLPAPEQLRGFRWPSDER
ncbi:MAG: hypothetical protein JHD16_10880 [Solirubrobacteraceae bacterium]|nr:hypothetical protein [Solirubrobacteraceae bacterium]